MSEFVIVPAKINDLANILALYQAVARVEGGLARTQNEITKEFIRFLFF